ncbi:efflux transporter outer membrane subunit [Paludibacterium purpuratum]|uniref:NodT family efflux transporter outer membrane factor (OMF) lipoprotein n=1 Tax=Paludibacterium purpuratum TaxID=1144873 RepID=A0A4R7AYC9_9NEIS|nr:efflux transporter outer membrane subunit [Paludibacterium purpuratum]TDR71453.1 NodT family efflux transporter outer membrane factor (OMF) lipoprotein [Paludibacterium purpuratum]
MLEKTARPGTLPGRLSCLAGVIAGLMLAGCAVGPDFATPTPPPHADYRPGNDKSLQTRPIAAPDAGNAGVQQTLSQGRDLPADWWTLFHSPELDTMIREALAHSPTLAAAEAAVRQAQENYNAELGTLAVPTINAQGSAARQRQVQGSPPPKDFTVYSGGLTVSYSLDVFGGGRRELESLAAQMDYQRYQLEAARQTLIFNVVSTAVQEAATRVQVDATRATLAALTAQLGIVIKQHQLGAQPLTAVLQQQQQVAQINASLPALEKSQALYRNQLATYLGRYPNDPDLPQIDLDALRLPQNLPLSLPSELVRQRPDIQASEALLHQASAEVGVATANLYPQITLSGSYARQRTDMNGGSSYASLWNMGAGLVMPLIDGGALRAHRRAAVAAYDQAAAQYRQTVLSAFQNVANTLNTIQADAGTLDAEADQAEETRQLRDIAQKRHQLGAISYLTVLDAERAYQQARLNLASSQAARFADTAMLYMALGGGWWNRTDPTQAGGNLKMAAGNNDNNIR